MPKLIFSLSLGLLLGSCQPLPSATIPVDPSPPPLTCNEPGSLVQAKIEGAKRGYAYQFSVYLPPCYASEATRYYPTLYLLPGRASGPNIWFAAGANAAADELILGGDVQPFIIVATEGIDSDPYGDTILGELIPHVERQYRVQAGRTHRAAAGGSLGGVGAYRLVFRHPDLFASAGMFGNGVISGEAADVQAWLQAIPVENRPRVFFNIGESDFLMLERAQEMMALLDAADIPFTSTSSEGGHSYSVWVANLPVYFRWLAQDW